MLDILNNFFDTLFPKSAEQKLLAKETVSNFVRHFSPERSIGAYTLASYDNAIIKAAITANKFHDHEEAAKLLASLIDYWHQTLPPANTIYVPIPLSSKRERSRGYNQVTRILTYSSVTVAPLLARTRDTKPQTSLKRTERFSNMEEAFIATIPKKFSYNRVVIVDDVVTTGATLRAAREALEPHLPADCKIICVALAH